MTLPVAIQIGPIRYQVLATTEAYNAVVARTNTHFYGHIQDGTTTITLDPDQVPDHMRWSLLHEVLHGCWHVSDPPGETFTEEQAIRAICGALLDTLRRNPALVAYLMATEEAPRHDHVAPTYQP